LEEKTVIAPVSSTSAPSARLANKIGTENFSKTLSPAVKTSQKISRLQSGISEFDRVLGGGFFAGSITLLTGDPGIGKSTLSLHTALKIAENNPEKDVVLISGEESFSQISDRIFRLQKTPPQNLLILSEGILENALSLLEDRNIGFLLFDSIQTLASAEIPSAPGSMAQTTTVTEKIMLHGKEKNIPCLLIGHVTKTGEMAGPQTMAHLVDTVLHLEGEKFSEYRILRSRKNRFGSVFEMGVFEMEESGLKEVKNPSKSFLSGRLKNAMGSVIFTALEGTRPFLVEVQALCKYTSFGYPKRSTSGFDVNRLNILLAVLSRYTNAKLDSEDVFVNIAGGMKVTEPASDLSVLAALISSKKKIIISSDTVFCGEIGLSGEVRQVSHLEKRLKEAEKLGFKKAIIPFAGKDVKTGLQITTIKTVQELEGVL
jgi:DNA repair protein RadA/Sms